LSVCFIALETPFKKLPDFWTVGICIYSCAHFIGFSILFHLIQFTLKDDDLNLKNSSINLFCFNSILSQPNLNNNNKKSD
jgi:hypothetical protein